MTYQFLVQSDPTLPDTDSIGIKRIADGATIPPSMGNKDWNSPINPTDPTDEGGYIQWRDAGNTAAPSATDQEKLEKHRADVHSYVTAQGEILRQLITEIENRLALSDKDAEAQLWWNNGSPPPPGFDPQTDAPFAWAHVQYRESLYTALGLTPPSQSQLATDILTEWHNLFTYMDSANKRIDAMVEQSRWALDLPAADTMTEISQIEATAQVEFTNIETYIKAFTP